MRKAQTALLNAYGHKVLPCTTFDEIDSSVGPGVDCLVVDLDRMKLSPTDCVNRIRSRGHTLSIILLVNPYGSDDAHSLDEFDRSCSDRVHILLQPIDVEQYLTLISTSHC